MAAVEDDEEEYVEGEDADSKRTPALQLRPWNPHPRFVGARHQTASISRRTPCGNGRSAGCGEANSGSTPTIREVRPGARPHKALVGCPNPRVAYPDGRRC